MCRALATAIDCNRLGKAAKFAMMGTISGMPTALRTDRAAERIHVGKRRKITGALMSSEDATRLLAENPALAEERALRILEQKPGNRTALLLLGAALRRQGRAEAAKTVLVSLTNWVPQYTTAQFELGLALADLGERANSVAAFLQVVDFDPAFTNAWYELGDSLALSGDGESGSKPLTEEQFGKRDLQLEASDAAFRSGRPDAAEGLLRELLVIRPDDAGATKLLADILFRTGRLADAEELLARCVLLAPDSLTARFHYATVLLASLDFQEALRQADELLRQDPASTLFHYLRAILLFGIDAFDRAIPSYEAVLQGGPHRAGVWIGYAHALKAVGQDRQCIEAFKRAIDLVPSFGDAYRQLASVKTFRFEPAMRDALRSQLALPHLLGADRAHLHFALAKALRDDGLYAEAFENYLKSNELQRKHIEYSARKNSESVRQRKAIFTPALLRLGLGRESDAVGPIFIVGMPRAGSTLIEQILCSHSAIEGLGELRSMSSVAVKAGDLSNVDDLTLKSLADEYLQLAHSRRKLGRPFFTDKMPGNFIHSGLICLMFRNARIVDARRHPLDCCLSCFTNFFPLGQPFASDLTELGRYYADYVELMGHFDEVFPGRIHRVIYERLVEQPESEVRRLLEYLGLPFEHGCLRFHETNRGVKTISAEQVRMPLYQHGMGQWHKFEPWLGPLKAALGRVLETYPAVPTFFPPGMDRNAHRIGLRE